MVVNWESKDKIMNWSICLEIGLNHMGSRKELVKIISTIIKTNINVGVSIQIREDSYYKKNKHYLLKVEDYIHLQKLCTNANIKLGFAIGEISDLEFFKKNKIYPYFIKILSIAAKKKEFVKKVSKEFSCPVFYSTGHLSIKYISKYLLPVMKNKDYLIHTSFSNDIVKQKINKLISMKSMHNNISYGLHCSKINPIFTAIGGGAKKIFVYVGNKKLNLKDKLHAIDLRQIKCFYKIVSDCFRSL